ncbi:hypothetical protein NVV94_14570 [Pseudomonas sp. LS1212]|uniref:hypothetical protein n=1 Tax=Pseudomonas sp. LS1212 TaxID=2972478 RepID=UPI00215C13BB|nr:hypothetical protein [Pseudomonas sp. LS1212]UVJ41926.1 hypothetical protein NVV94_14570 [Pseudomonas sp. LS1212]
MTLNELRQRLRDLGALVNEMEILLDDDTGEAPLAFFEACEEMQDQVTKLMHATFIAAQSKRE